MKAVVVAAGKGSRLHPFSVALPKPLMPVGLSGNGAFQTIIERIIIQLERAGITEIAIIVNHRAETIRAYLSDGLRLGVSLRYFYQRKLDGNAGAFYCARPLFERGEAVLLTDCDNYLSDTAFAEMIEQHRAEDPDLTVAVGPVDDVTKYAIIRQDSGGRPIAIVEKPDHVGEWGNLAKGGSMILSPALAALDRSISRVTSGEYTTTGIVHYCIVNGLRVSLSRVEGGFSDIGTWEEYLPLLAGNLRGLART